MRLGKNMKTKLLWAGILAPVIASAQFTGGGQSGFDFGGGASTDKPWTQFKLNPKTRVKLALSNATADAVIKFYENVSGITIVKDPALTGTLPITSARAVPLSDAFDILSQTLSLKGFSLSKNGNLLIIKQNGKGNQNSISFPTGAGDLGGGNDNALVPRLYPIKFANASQLAATLNSVYAPITNAQGGGNFQFQQGGQNRPGGFGGFGGAQAQIPTVRASSDDFSNSVIVNAPERIQGQLSDLIKKLDQPSELPQTTKVYKLTYASAQDMVAVVQTVLTANVPRGRGGATTGQTSGPGAFFSALRGQTAGSGQVVADNRTNSLVVTATDDDIKIIDKVIQNVDHNIPIQSTTFVIPLNSARADAVATIIQQAYGNKQGVSTPNTTQTQNTSQSVSKAAGGTGLNNSATASRSVTGAQDLSNDPTATMALVWPGSGVSNPVALPNAEAQKKMLADGQKALSLPLADANAQSGDLMTSIAVQGFGGGFGGGRGGGGGGGQSGSNSQTTYSTGRTATGELVQTRDLTGQVTAIADINTNSLIVVASPEYADIIRKMVAQLDKIPQQVLIQTVIVEASLDSSTKLGVEWNLTSSLSRLLGDPTASGTGGTNFGVQSSAVAANTAGTGGGFTYAVSGKGFSAFLQALQTDAKFQVLATPRIFTTNNVQGQINVSQSIPYVTSVQSDSAGNPTYAYSFLPVGIILTILPRVLNNGMVTLDVDQTANELEGYVNVGNVSAPEVNQREASTTVSVKDGDTVILGGIIQKTLTSTTNKVPLLGDLPILGNLFRYTTKDNGRTELMVFMTPHVISGPEDAVKLAQGSLKDLTPETRTQADKQIPKPN
jgi:general secretion pathway protein D